MVIQFKPMTLQKCKGIGICTVETIWSELTVFHGIAQYFDIVLYGSVMLPIHPDTASKEMYDWFSNLFPIIGFCAMW